MCGSWGVGGFPFLQSGPMHLKSVEMYANPHPPDTYALLFMLIYPLRSLLGAPLGRNCSNVSEVRFRENRLSARNPPDFPNLE